MDDESLYEEAVNFVKKEMAGQDGSHDFQHVQRVQAVAMTLAKEEQLTDEEIYVVRLAALLHDVGDWKYTGSETSGVELSEQFLKGTSLTPERVKQIIWIIGRVSFHSELDGNKENATEEEEDFIRKTNKLLYVVQDADRMDAIGALGIARTFCFGGSRKNILYDQFSLDINEAPLPKKAKYVNKPSESTLYHFYEKLFHLKDMMKTEAGIRMAKERDAFLHTFVDRLKLEVAGLAWRVVGQ